MQPKPITAETLETPDYNNNLKNAVAEVLRRTYKILIELGHSWFSMVIKNQNCFNHFESLQISGY
jgi:hypothetical protein